MLLKILAVASMVILPLSALLWRQSHAHPVQYRYDVTPNQSLRVYLIDGVCGLRLLTMPTKTKIQSEFQAALTRDPTPTQGSFLLTSHLNGPYRTTWFVFPLWLTTGLLTTVCTIPIITGPVRQRWRKWKGLCVQCGYNLRGNRTGRCSECGFRYRHADHRMLRY